MIPSRPNLTEFSTKDIYLATVIKLAGIPIIRIESNERQGIFVFESSEDIEAIIVEYFNGRLKFDPKSLFETWKSLKAMAFAKINDVR